MKVGVKLSLAILALVAGIGLSGGLLRALGMPADLMPINWPVEGDKPEQTAIWGRYSQSSFGWAMTVGDINGDGFDDLIASARFTPGTDQIDGEVYVIQGPLPLNQSYSKPPNLARVIKGSSLDAQFGIYLDSGDMNGDGFDDIAMASWPDGVNFVYLGSPDIQAGSPLTITASPETMAITVSKAEGGMIFCDFNADGYQDLFFKDYELESAANVWGILGSPNITATQPVNLQLPSDANIIITGFDPTWWSSPAEQSMACGDINGDGTPDLAVGMETESPQNRYGAGRVYIISGDPAISASQVVTLTMPDDAGAILEGVDSSQGTEGDALGTSLAAADVNLDGRADLIIGAPGGWGLNNWYGLAGEVYLWLGRPLEGQRIPISSQASWTVYGEDIYNYLGGSISASDFDGDGAPEILLGCSMCDVLVKPDSISGKGYLIEPLDFIGIVPVNEVSQLRILPYNFSPCLGWFVSNMDIDGDGSQDVLIGTPCSGNYVGNQLPGTIYAISYPIRTRVFLPLVQQDVP